MARRKSQGSDPQQAAVEALVADVRTPEQLEEVFRALKQRMVEQVLQAELTEHLAMPRGQAARRMAMRAMGRRRRPC